MMLAESGLGACIVRTDTVTEELKGTVFCFAAASSAIIIVLLAVLAYPIGYLIKEPTFPSLLMGMSTILLISSFNIVPAAILLRNKRYDWIAIGDMISIFAGIFAVSIGLILHWGVWSLVAQQIVFWIFKVVFVSVKSGYRPRLMFRSKIIKENINFGFNLTGATILDFLSKNIDNVLIGTFLGAEELGYYALAFQIIGLPQMILAGSVYHTLFSSISEAHRAGRKSAAQFLKVLRGVLFLSAPALVGLAATAPLSVPVLLGDKWTPAALLLILLTPMGLCQAIGGTAWGVMVGLGRADIIFRISLLSSTTTIFAILVGVFAASSKAVAIGLSIAAAINCYAVVPILLRELDTNWGEVMKSIAAPVISALLMGTVVVALEQIMPDDIPLVARLVLSIFSGMLSYTLILFCIFRNQLKEDIDHIKVNLQSRL